MRISGKTLVAKGMIPLCHVNYQHDSRFCVVYGDKKTGDLLVNTDDGLVKYDNEVHGNLLNLGTTGFWDESYPEPMPEPPEPVPDDVEGRKRRLNINPVGAIIEVVALKEIKNPDYVGPGDAAEYCAEHNLYHTVSQLFRIGGYAIPPFFGGGA